MIVPLFVIAQELQDTDKQWNALTQDVGDVVQEKPLDESAGRKSIGVAKQIDKSFAQKVREAQMPRAGSKA